MKKPFLTLLILLCMSIFIAGCSNGLNGENRDKVLAPREQENKTKVVYVTQTAPPNMLQQLKGKEIAGFIAWEPFNSNAIVQDLGKYLFTSQEIWPGQPCCVLAASGSLQNERTLQALVWANTKAINFINNPANQAAVINYAVEFTGRSREIIVRSIRNIQYIDYPSRQEFGKYYRKLTQGNLLTRELSDLGYDSADKFFTAFFNANIYAAIKHELKENPDWQPPKVEAGQVIRMGYISNDLHQLPLYIAQREGYYQEAGIMPEKNLKIKQFPNGVAIMTAFKAKDIDVAYLGGAPATLKRINDNIPISIIAGANQEGSGLVVLPEIKSIQDLAGQTVAVPGLGTVQYMLLEQELSKNGLTMELK